MVVEIETVAALDAQKLAVDAGMVAVIAADNVVVARSQRGLAAVRAVRANSAHMGHFPRPRLIAIRAAAERAHRADVDTRAALVAFEVIAVVRGYLRKGSAVDHA